MNLVRDSAPAVSAELCGLPSPLTLGPAVAAIIGVQTTPAVRQPLTRTLRIAGTIEVDATRRRTLTAWTDGRIERLFVNSVGAEIRTGEPLFALFSRDLLSLQQELLQLAGAGANSASALAEQRLRLMQFGLTHRQVEELLVSREPSTTPVIMAPENGTIIAKAVEEGQWVRTGDRLFEIADFSRLWFVFELSVPDQAWARVGTRIEFSVEGTTLSAPLAFIDPNLNPATHAATARAEFANPGGLSRGALAEGRLHVEHGEALVIPLSAVLDAGTGPVAWVDRGAFSYEPRVLQLGRRGDTTVEVLGGVAEGERVVTHGALLIDAQAQLVRPPSPASAPRQEPE